MNTGELPINPFGDASEPHQKASGEPQRTYAQILARNALHMLHGEHLDGSGVQHAFTRASTARSERRLHNNKGGCYPLRAERVAVSDVTPHCSDATLCLGTTLLFDMATRNVTCSILIHFGFLQGALACLATEAPLGHYVPLELGEAPARTLYLAFSTPTAPSLR